MGWISPQQLYDDPKLWLNIPHKFHDSLMKLQTKMFPDWPEKLKEIDCHCLLCEGKEPVRVTIAKTGKPGLLTGYVKKPEQLLMIKEE